MGLTVASSNVRWALIGVGTAVLALGVLIVVVRSTAPPPALELRVPEAPGADGVLKVYVTGAVAQPGTYQLRPGDRYGDALAVAGGPTDDAEPLAVNMARRVRDEDHIHVPRRGEAPAGVGAGAPVLDLNTATVAQLETLPGIGPVRAQKIVESRARDGAFSRPEDLVQRKLIPQSMLEPLRELVLVRQ
jgi:competence protein ComEA